MECYGTGMGFALFRSQCSRIASLQKPWFKNKKGINGEGVGTQDLVFAEKARKLGYRCAVIAVFKLDITT